MYVPLTQYPHALAAPPALQFIQEEEGSTRYNLIGRPFKSPVPSDFIAWQHFRAQSRNWLFLPRGNYSLLAAIKNFPSHPFKAWDVVKINCECSRN